MYCNYLHDIVVATCVIGFLVIYRKKNSDFHRFQKTDDGPNFEQSHIPNNFENIKEEFSFMFKILINYFLKQIRFYALSSTERITQ